MRKIVEKSMLGKVWTVLDDYNLNQDFKDADALVRAILISRGIKTDAEIEKFLRKNCMHNDLCITMGAGNIEDVGDHLVSQ